MTRSSNWIYWLPCKPGSVYVNITDACLNDCLFCVKRGGLIFFGSDLTLGRILPSSDEIIENFQRADKKQQIQEVVFCGMGEPLLRYDCVLNACRGIRELRKDSVSIRVDTSGLAWGENKNLDILSWIDDLSISLNAENPEKYEELCRPKIMGAYDILMNFLRALKEAEVRSKMQGEAFPKVRLSIVDTSEEIFIPVSGRAGYAIGSFPVPDFNKCNKIADKFGWPLIIKRLFRDSCDEIWNEPVIRDMYARGIEIERCKDCAYRH